MSHFKHFAFALLTALACGTSAKAYDFAVDGIYYNITSSANKEVSVTYGTRNVESYSDDVIIPNTVKYSGTTYTVKQIGEQAFNNCANLTSVFVPSSVTSIGAYAFYGDNKLTNITLQEGLTNIGEFAFAGCFPKDLYLPGTLKRGYNWGALMNCHLTTVVIGEGLSSISDFFAYDGSRDVAKIDNLVIPSTYDKWSLSEITMYASHITLSPNHPELMMSDGMLMSKDRTQLFRVTSEAAVDFEIPSTVTYMASTALENNRRLVSVKGDFSVANNRANFTGCTSLQSVDITAKYVEFSGCKALTKVNMSGVQWLYDHTFDNCVSLKEIFIPASVSMIEEYTFSRTSLERIYMLGTTPPQGFYDNGDDYEDRQVWRKMGQTVYVPQGCASSYNWSSWWSDVVECAPFISKQPTSENPKVEIAMGYTTAYTWCNAVDDEPIISATDAILDLARVETGARVYCKVYFYQSGLELASDVITVEKPCWLYNGNATVTNLGWNTLTLLPQLATTNPLLFADNTILPDNAAANVATRFEIYGGGEWWAHAVELDDATPFYSPYDINVGQVRYTRNFQSTAWQPLYVPFSMQSWEWEDVGKVAYINNVHQYDDDENGTIDRTILEFITVKSGELKPNTPYVIKPFRTGTTTLTAHGSKLKATLKDGSVSCASTSTQYTLTGTYQEISNMYSKGYYAMSDGDFKLAENSSVKLSPFRFYLDIKNNDGSSVTAKAPRVRVVVDGVEDANDATGIGQLTGEKAVDGESFSLQGIRVADNYKGIVIKNGRKHIQK